MNLNYLMVFTFYSVSDIKDFIEYIIRKHETLPTNPPIHFISRRLIID